MAKEEDYLHVIKTTVQNFKGIVQREIEFDGRSALIIGPNDTGKSSLIQAVMSPLNSKWTPLEPVTKGEERGKVEVELAGRINGEQVEYVIKTFFSPEHQKGRLVIENGLGQKITGGASMVQSITGEIGFDIMEFIRMGRTPSGGVSKEGVRKQIEVLKSLLSHDEKKAIYKLETDYQTKYDERTEINREMKRLQLLVESNKFDQEFIEKYKEPIDATIISQQIIDAGKHNENVKKANEILNDHIYKLTSIDETISRLEKELEDAKEKKSTLIEQFGKTEKWREKNDFIDVKEIEGQLSTISEHNENNRKIADVEQWIKDAATEKEKSDKITSELVKLVKAKKDVFANSALPIKGLEFDDEMITYNGLPLDSDQISTAKLIGIGLMVGMAYNSNLRLLIIRDGSLLDKKMLDYILKLCAEKNYQVLIEMVSFERNENEVRFIEKS